MTVTLNDIFDGLAEIRKWGYFKGDFIVELSKNFNGYIKLKGDYSILFRFSRENFYTSLQEYLIELKNQNLENKENWLAEFYPIPADEINSKIAAIKHSLRKWTGLMPANLAKHNLTQPSIDINCDTCALCVLYLDHSFSSESACIKCPLYKTLGKKSCDDYKRKGMTVSIFSEWEINRNPKPMINALTKCLKENTRSK